eukprot:365685-Chlamydomonas_euryale.AAC.1
MLATAFAHGLVGLLAQASCVPASATAGARQLRSGFCDCWCKAAARWILQWPTRGVKACGS